MADQSKGETAAGLPGSSELVLEPGLPIVDPHHHLWDRPGWRYLADDFLADARSGHRIVATVFVECRSHYRTGAPPEIQPVGETDYVAHVAARYASEDLRLCAGIIGYADLRAGDRVQTVLDAHAAAGPGRFRGVRQIAAWDEHPEILATTTLKLFPGLFADSAFRAGFARLATQALTYEAWIYHTQIPELSALLHACPATRVVLDHAATPIGIGPYAARKQEIFAAWRRGIRELARHPNLFVKVGGLGMPVLGFGFERTPQPPSSEVLAEQWRPYVETVIESFGPNRCMFESNFPVDRASASYLTLWNTFKRLASQYSASERAALFGGVARSVYRLG